MAGRGLRPTSTATAARSRLLSPGEADAQQMAALRELLVGPEQTRLDDVEAALPTATTVGSLLPEALTHASEARSEELVMAMTRPVVGTIRDVARREPLLFGEILAPTIGTAVRRAVADAIKAMIERLDQLLDRGLSLHALRCRLIARRTGRSYAEVAIARSTIYRVEWVALIHTETSLVLEQATAAHGAAEAPDQIAGMLQAINAFVSEAFQPVSPGGELQTLEVGDLDVWIEREPAFTIAAAIRGSAPIELREVLRNALSRVRMLHAETIERAHPVPAYFADTRPILETCLQQRLRPPRRKARSVIALVVLAVLGLVLVLAVRAGDRARDDRALRAAYEAALVAEPGTVVLSIAGAGDRWRIVALQDPRATPAAHLIAEAGLPSPELEVAAFDSRDPRLAGPVAQLDAIVGELERVAIAFERGDSAVAPSDPEIVHAAALIGRAHRTAREAGLSLCIDVIGHSDETGPEAVSARVRAARAQNVARALHASGVERDILVARAGDALLARPYSRQAALRAVLRPASADGRCSP